MNKYIDLWINKSHNVCMGIAPRSPPIEFAPTLCRVRPHTFRVRPHQVEFAPWLSDQGAKLLDLYPFSFISFIHLDIPQSRGELDLIGSNSKSVGANTVWGRGELEGANSIGGESGGYPAWNWNGVSPYFWFVRVDKPTT